MELQNSSDIVIFRADHFDSGNLVELNPSALSGYYLLEAAAVLEAELMFHFSDQFETMDFTPFSGPHLFRAVVLEGTANKFRNERDAFMIQEKQSSETPLKGLFLNNNSLNTFAGKMLRQNPFLLLIYCNE